MKHEYSIFWGEAFNNMGYDIDIALADAGMKYAGNKPLPKATIKSITKLGVYTVPTKEQPELTNEESEQLQQEDYPTEEEEVELKFITIEAA